LPAPRYRMDQWVFSQGVMWKISGQEWAIVWA